ncbi:hypothetical protein AaE_011103 [Aphanomyces astaci]|uniref:Uncharacterized protein n=1 Tax=Aphanomyces astaci TaxID=112090 RepID=A0A6A5A179_APHAT|nr:hypothetical protein AaE_011103 [Aphanomyces astaci]
MVRRFTILDHLTTTSADSSLICQEDVVPYGLSDFLREVQHHPCNAEVAPSTAPTPPRTFSGKGDELPAPGGTYMSFQPPCFGDEEEDDHMDQDELYQRILLQHPDLLAPPSSTVPADSGIDIEYTYQPVDATETFHDQVILMTSPCAKVGHRDDAPSVSSSTQHKPVKDKNRHELDPALADILRRHKELQMKRTTIMTHPTIQRQLKSFWYRPLCVKPAATPDSGVTGLTREVYHHFYATLLRGITTGWEDGLAASMLHRGWEFDRRGMEWVEDTTLPEYQRVLKRFRYIVQTTDPPRAAPDGLGADIPDIRLVEFNQRLLLQAEQKALQVLLGKSIDFDASAYLHQQSHQSSPTQLLPPRRPFSSSTAHFLCAGDAKFEGLRPIQSVAQIQINVKEKVRPATGGATRRDSAPDIKKPMPALGRPLIHPKSAGKDKSRPPGIQHPLPHL